MLRFAASIAPGYVLAAFEDGQFLLWCSACHRTFSWTRHFQAMRAEPQSFPMGIVSTATIFR